MQTSSFLTGGTKGTLTEDALEAVLGACEELGVRPRNCAPKIINRDEPFTGMSELAAKEAALLLEQCRGSEELADCRIDIEDERYIRSQAIGRAEPDTLQMRQYEEVIWSVSIRSTDIDVTPGQTSIRENSPPGAPDQPGAVVPNAIAYTRSTCFVLEYKADEFDVAEDRICPEFRRGNTPYTAKWTVEPQKSGNLRLWVKAVHQRDGREMRAETVPTSPFEIEVEHWLVKILKELGLWNELAAGIGTLIAAVMGWGIWKLFKRGKPDPQTPPS